MLYTLTMIIIYKLPYSTIQFYGEDGTDTTRKNFYS